MDACDQRGVDSDESKVPGGDDAAGGDDRRHGCQG